ncbi:transposase [Pelagibius litoralis]|uniref:Transposase n=1 Tax=Pelagibius litoralis TaxID=374515 RepID=A0A967F1Q0_9PROT|nr:transposase [Pelagibius litoralis]
MPDPIETLPNLDDASFRQVERGRLLPSASNTNWPRILLLHGSLRNRSFSRLVTEEAARILRRFGAETRTFNLSGLPLPDDAAWLGLVPRQYSSGGKERIGRISKRGDDYLGKLLVHGARTVLLWSRRKKEGRSRWQEALRARRPTNVVLVAMANKTARVVWAMLSRGETFRAEARAAA